MTVTDELGATGRSGSARARACDPRWPIEPLAKLLCVELHQDGVTVMGSYRPQDGEPLVGWAALADALGIESRRWVKRLVARGGWCDRYAADRAAVAAGFHPALVWEDWWNVDDLASEEDAAGWFSDDPTLADLGPTAA